MHTRVNGGDSLAAGRGRQRLKLAALGYASSRHGVDAEAALARAGLTRLCQVACEFVGTLPGSVSRINHQGDSELLQLAAIAYASARHGIDADVGMAREGLAMLCQAAISYVESLPWEDPVKRPTSQPFQTGEWGLIHEIWTRSRLLWGWATRSQPCTGERMDQAGARGRSGCGDLVHVAQEAQARVLTWTRARARP